VLLKSFILTLEVEVSIHQSLVRVVDSFEVSVLTSLFNLERVEFSLHALKGGGQFMSSIVLVAISLELDLLVLN
jgi:hypothetical protein